MSAAARTPGVLAKLYFTVCRLLLRSLSRSSARSCPALLPAPVAPGARRTKRTMTQNKTGHGDKKNATRVSETNSDTKAISLRATCAANYEQQGIYFCQPLSAT